MASKISEIDAVLAQMDTNSTEYALITSVKDLLGDITALLTSSRVVRSAGSKMNNKHNVFFINLFQAVRLN